MKSFLKDNIKLKEYRTRKFFFFSAVLLTFVFIVFSQTLMYPYKFLNLDDFNHLARARWSIFGERKITFLQRDKTINYSWLLHALLYPFCYEKEKSKISLKVNDKYQYKEKSRNCIKAYIFLKSSVALMILSGLFILMARYGFINTNSSLSALGILFPISIAIYLLYVQTDRLLSYLMLMLFVFGVKEKKYRLIILIQVLWSNIHLFSVFGPAIFFISAVLRGFRKKDLMFSGICFTVSLINPYHIYLYKDFLDHLIIYTSGMLNRANLFSETIEIKPLFYNISWEISKAKLVFFIFIFLIQVTALGKIRLIALFSPILILPLFIRRFLELPVFITSIFMKGSKVSFFLSLMSIFPSLWISSYYSKFNYKFNMNAEKLTREPIFDTKCKGIVHSAFPSIVVFFKFPKMISYYDFFTSWNKLDKFRSPSDTYEELIRNRVSCIVSSPQFYSKTPMRFPKAVIWQGEFFKIIDVNLLSRFYQIY